ncbi:MAG: hypothetical protein CO186_03635 [Zetaproteobacteria bacterium CG_4_9_14_3_um_filter_49_83]|nr:MAG: hypothetical protein AUJ56_02025 [Zetaproteobacteria bacterium CG1_02_49_23]PIQ29928.1 MAG: hypothetical protein COW62_14215 [Zetaproteobacteria bacterium CG17_big_fil_post_rev_8_21_14_2_50_50_13]PIV29847.1 MAG: hypothetical protein COS35_09810 [Zetaproteobacteria bacterium CG02_land_8_20_14_3_00_50_9]PIY56910.1 MAG: hypothetical protein COZ00_01880 [Zetaproteobacteria bacterium CG_4_10_14_0_8_um_filter_49_80]PJA35833.1 MAG: hypothetical protein CO186_03635 [Zetaproteobacteria bacterium
MNKMTKHMIIAAMMVVLPVSAIACETKGVKSPACTLDGHGSYHGKQGHNAIPGRTPDYLRNILKGADRIGLNGKQRTMIGELLVEAESDAAKAHAEAEVTVAEFKLRLHSGSLSDKEVNAYTKKMGELRAAQLAANLKASVAASRLLSDEQKAKLYTSKKYDSKKYDSKKSDSK